MVPPSLQGAVGGLIATVPMTVLMEMWHRRLPMRERYPLPPRQITLRAARQAGVAPFLSDGVRKALTLGAHFGFGSSAGTLYGAACGHAVPAGPKTGALYGLIVWAGSYLGLLPALGLLRPATRHPRRRNALMIVAHFVWGLTLGCFTQWMQSAERRPWNQTHQNVPHGAAK